MSEQYANGDKIRYAYDEDSNLIAQYHNNSTQPYVTYTYTDGELTQKVNQDAGLRYVYSEENKVDVYRTSDNAYVQSYFREDTENEVTLENGDCFEYDPETGESYNIPQTNPASYTTVEEMHFGALYTSVTSDKRVIYTAGTDKLEYGYKTNTDDDEEKMAADYVKYNDSVNLSSKYEYDGNRNITHKVVTFGDEETLEVVNTYDSKDRITSISYNNKTYNYTYDEDSQLTAVNGDDYTASYVYDNRGNITNKTVNGESTTFTYAENGWIDQLISVNGTSLTYDANGNVLTYGDKEYIWTNGRTLSQITENDNTYSYTYDESGIRTSKTVNGVTTYYNTKDGIILSQTDGENTLYFQYDTSGIPLGFIFNEVQYFYITNQMGDVIGITDNAGNLIAQYEYDEWGNVLSISDNDIANANPIRYRGYYYDAETGYYYLQSRYYDPSICRFINADVSGIAKISEKTANEVDIFIYCNNNPINGVDHFGLFNWNSLRDKIGYFISKMKDKIFSYFKSQFDVNSSGITIGASLMAAVFDTIASFVLTAVLAKALKGTIKSIVKIMVNKFPGKFKSLIHSIFNYIRNNKVCYFLANTILYVVSHKAAKKIVSRKYSFGNTVKALAKDMIFSMYKLENKLLDNLLYVATSFSSFGGILSLILDLCDFKLDKKLFIPYVKLNKIITC